MRVVRTVSELRAELAPARGAGRRIGLVPTMGALHEGHLSLVRHAHEQCDVVVVSLFVNPSQFNEASDLERYPRDEQSDRELAAAAGADILFAPRADEVYPAGFATSVEVIGISERFEGEMRGAAHFRGVATIVTKLLCMTLPDAAYFGRKDAQQLVLIRRLVADLNLPVEIVGCPTVRELDGLAMSSRNALLDEDARSQAAALWQALQSARTLASAGERSSRALTDAARAQLSAHGVAPEYVALVDPDSFEPLQSLSGRGLLTIAAHVGGVRLIDNDLLDVAALDGAPGRDLATCSA